MKSDLISPAYRDEQRRLHETPKGYGGKGSKWANGVIALAARHQCRSVLDYGCGQGTLVEAIRERTRSLQLREYDPAIPGKDTLPKPADLVACTDVIEHIEPEKLDAVLAHLFQLADQALFVVIATRPANKTLSDGRNAHLIVQPAEWWREKLDRPDFEALPGPGSESKKPSREWSAVFLRR